MPTKDAEVLNKHDYLKRYPERLRPTELSFDLFCSLVAVTLEQEDEFALKISVRITAYEQLPDGECTIRIFSELLGASEPITITKEGDLLSNALEDELRKGYVLADEEAMRDNPEVSQSSELVLQA